MNYPYNITAEEIEIIDQWLSGDMPPGQSAIFAARLQNEKLLQQQVDEVRLLLLGVKEIGLKWQLNSFHAHLQPAATTPKKNSLVIPMGRRLLLAASVLAIISLLSIWLLKGGNGNEKLYIAYYTPDPGLITTMGNSNSYAFEKAMVAYKEGDYKKAIAEWASLQAAQPANDTLTYFLGVAYQAAGQEEKAVEQLEKSAIHTVQPFYSNACWYLGLAKLKKGETAAAIMYLKKSSHPQSVELVNTLNKK